jgi:hypothetical protein
MQQQYTAEIHHPDALTWESIRGDIVRAEQEPGDQRAGIASGSIARKSVMGWWCTTRRNSST